MNKRWVFLPLLLAVFACHRDVPGRCSGSIATDGEVPLVMLSHGSASAPVGKLGSSRLKSGIVPGLAAILHDSG